MLTPFSVKNVVREDDGGWVINLAASDLLSSTKVTDNRLSLEINLSELDLKFPNQISIRAKGSDIQH